MNFQGLFTTARVLRAVYQIASTSILLVYLVRRQDDKPTRSMEDRLRRLDRE